jgi:pilus assembly protein Flp/PilA
MSLINRLRAMVSDESGQDLLEYALLTALIALVAAAAIQAAGIQVDAIFDQIAAALTGAA